MKNRGNISTALKVFVILMIVVILITDIASMASRVKRTIASASQNITETLSETNYKETTLRMLKLFPAQTGAGASMQVTNLPDLPLGQSLNAKPVLFLYKRVLNDTTNTPSLLEDLVNGKAEGESLTDKVGNTFNPIQIDAKDIDFATFDSLLTVSLNEKDLRSAYKLELKRQKDTLEVIRHTESRTFHKSLFNKTFTHKLNAEGTVWYEYTAFMPGVIFDQNEFFVIYDLFFGLIIIMMIAGLYVIFRLSDQVNKRSEDFLHMLTHDMKSPVATIKLACGELAEIDDAITPERADYLSLIERNCDLIQQKIETIIPLTERLKAGVKELKDINLYAFVAHLASSIVKSEDISVSVDILEKLHVKADPDLLDVIFRNLIENSIKYGPSDGKTEIKISADVKKNDKCIVTLSDNGIGISKQDLPFIFTKFYKANKDKKDSRKSYGLGLYYVKESADLMKWEIKVNSTLNKGTSFIISIPGINIDDTNS